MIAVMYHYVRPFDSNLPYFKNLHLEDFKTQLDYFEKEYGFVSKKDFIASLKTKVPVKGVILTFDDGLKCHHKFVLPELLKRNLWGIFYVSTKPYHVDKILDVHRIHLLLGMHSGETVYNALMPLISKEMLPDVVRKEFQELTYELQDNDNYTQSVKRILNYYISYEYREIIIDQLMNQLIPETIDSVSNFYINDNEISDLHQKGMIVGSHSESHSLMSKLSVEKQIQEIDTSFDYLKKVLNDLEYKSFCYPYGGFHSFTQDTEKILFDRDVLFSFNVEHREIEAQDLKDRPQALPRYDCNHFPHGKCRT